MKQQQEKLEGLDGVVEKLEEFLSAESDVTSLQQRITSLDSASLEQSKFLNEVSVQPPILEEGLDEDFREVHRNVANIESSHQSATLKQRLDLKVRVPQACEIVSKEKVLGLVKDTTEKVNQARQEFTGLVEEFESDTQTTFQECKDHVEAMRGRCARDKQLLTEAMDEEMIYGKAGGNNWLQGELFHLVDREVDGMRLGLERRYKQLELIFKQELVTLKRQFDDLKGKANQLHHRPEMNPEEVIEMHTDSRNSLFTLEKSHKSKVAGLAEVLSSIKENLQQVSADIQIYLHSLKSEESSEQSNTESKKAEFEEMLTGVHFQIDMLRRSVYGLESNLSGELYRVSERLKSIELSSSIMGRTGHSQGVIDLENLSPRLRHVQEQLPPMVDQLKTQVAELAQELRELWTRVNVEAGMSIPMPEAMSDMPEGEKDVLRSFFDEAEQRD